MNEKLLALADRLAEYIREVYDDGFGAEGDPEALRAIETDLRKLATEEAEQ